MHADCESELRKILDERKFAAYQDDKNVRTMTQRFQTFNWPIQLSEG